MPTFRVTSPDGKEYEVNTPDGVKPSHEDLVNYVLSQHVKEDEPKPDPYAKMNLDQIKAQYHGAQLTNASPDVLSKIADAYVSKEQGDISRAGGIMGGITGVANAADNFGRDFARGIPIVGGGLDEASAALNTLVGGNYQENLDYQRARDRFNDNQFGGLSTATQIGGGVASGFGIARLLGLGTGAAPTVTRFMPTFGQALKAGAAGAGIGAADMYTRGEGDNRPAMAAAGGALGAVVGTAAPYVGAGVSAGTQRLLNFLTSDAALRRLGISREAADVLVRQLSTDDTLSNTGAQRIQAAGPDAMLADAGPAATNLLDTALQRSGPGSTAARDAIESRISTASNDLGQTLDDTLGQPIGVATRQKGLRTSTAGDRASKYDAAYDSPIDYSGEYGQAIEGQLRNVPEKAVNAANELMRAEGKASKQIKITVNEDGTISFSSMPDVRQIDYITRGLRQVVKREEDKGQIGGGLSDVGRIYNNLSNSIRGLLKKAAPSYKDALESHAVPARLSDSIDFGKTLLNRNTPVDEAIAAIKAMGGAERKAAMSGLRDHLDQIIGDAKKALTANNLDANQLREALREISSTNARKKISNLLGDDMAGKFFSKISQFERAAEMRANLATNSKTFGRSSTDAQVKAQTEPGFIGLALEGHPMQAARKVFQRLTGMTPERRLEMEDKIYGDIAKALTTVRGKAAENHLKALRAAVQAKSTNNQGARALGQKAAVGAASAAYQGTVSGSRR